MCKSRFKSAQQQNDRHSLVVCLSFGRFYHLRACNYPVTSDCDCISKSFVHRNNCGLTLTIKNKKIRQVLYRHDSNVVHSYSKGIVFQIWKLSPSVQNWAIKLGKEEHIIKRTAEKCCWTVSTFLQVDNMATHTINTYTILTNSGLLPVAIKRQGRRVNVSASVCSASCIMGGSTKW